jgi:hypothetical protein
MSTFDERQREFEARFKHDEELAFKIRARRDRLLGLWAARHIGLLGAAAEDYAKEVVAAEFSGPRGRGVVEKVVRDFAARGIAIDALRVEDELHRVAEEARKQIEQR